MEQKKTVVIGASPNPGRYSYRAVSLLQSFNHQVIAVGIKNGEINGIPIHKGPIEITDVHTVTLYIGPARQPEYFDYIFRLNPKRIIFNPGTENDNLYQLAKEKGIEVVEDCTLVMLNSGRF